jgi:hypothetical protein
MYHNFILVTRNEKDFEDISKLSSVTRRRFGTVSAEETYIMRFLIRFMMIYRYVGENMARMTEEEAWSLEEEVTNNPPQVSGDGKSDFFMKHKGISLF